MKMKYFNTPIDEQESIINIIYEEQIISIYSNRVEIIENLTKLLGKPDIKYRKSKTYWSGARWNIDFNDNKRLKKVLSKDAFIEKAFKEERKIKKINYNENEDYQIKLEI